MKRFVKPINIIFICADQGVCGSSNYKVVLDLSGINNPPFATNLKIDYYPDWCAFKPAYFFSWIYTDPDNDPESRFDFQIDTDSNFSSPIEPINRSYNNLDPELYPSGKQNSQAAEVITITRTDYLTYNKTYWWRARVWDSQGANSGWVAGGSFTTTLHHWPSCDFSRSPQFPKAGQRVQFTDNSTCYDDNPEGSPCTSPDDSFSWTFPDADPSSSTDQNPATTFLSEGAKQVTLKVTDSDGFSCPITKTITITRPFGLPIWREVIPI